MRQFIFLIISSLSCFTCSAQDYSSYYFNAGLGLNFVDIEEVHEIDVAFNPGFIGTLSIGFPMSRWLKAETEFAARTNTFKKISVDGHDFGVNGHLTKVSLMENFILDLTQKKYCPYFGFGVGLNKDSGKIDVTIREDSGDIYDMKAKIDKCNTAFQLLGGIDIPVGEVSRFKLEYKYFQSEQDETNHSITLKAQKNF